MKIKVRYTYIIMSLIIIIIIMRNALRIRPVLEVSLSDPDSCPIRGQRWAVSVVSRTNVSLVREASLTHQWNFILLGDKSIIENLRNRVHARHVLLLTASDLAQLEFRSVKHISHSSMGLLNVAYLLAIFCGAKQVYELNQDISRVDFDQTGFLGESAVSNTNWIAFRSQQSAFVNIFGIFGNPDIYPRGVPLEDTEAILQSGWSRLRRNEDERIRALIHHKVINFAPDVDARTYLTRQYRCKSVQFDSNRGQVVLEPFTFSPYNSRNTIHHYDAFWGLYMPIVLSSKISDIIRSLWVQRLLWDIQGHVQFSTSSSELEIAHNITEYDLESDLFLNKKVNRIVKVLIAWSSKSTSFRERFQDLMGQLEDLDLIPSLEYSIFKTWIDDLSRTNYNFPNLTSMNSKHKSLSKVVTVKRAAVCVTGLAECIVEIWSQNEKKLRSRFPGDLDVFLFLSSGNGMPSSISKSIYEFRLKQARLYNSTVNILHDDILNLNPGFTNDCNYKYILTKTEKIIPIEQERYSQAMCFEAVKEYEKKTNTKYDLLIRARSDSVLTRLPETFERQGRYDLNKYLIVPDEHHYYGLNDRFAVGPMHLMKFYMSRWFDLKQCYTEIVHPETFLAFILEMYKVKVTKDPEISLTQVPHGQKQCH